MKFKKIILTVFFVFSVISSLYPQQYWLNMASPVSLELKKSCFLDSLNGWVAGDSGLIMKTTTGGQNWIIQDSRTRYPVHEIFFLNKRLGWALAWNLFGPLPPFGTFILKTTNGGNSWDTSIFATENTFIQTVYFQDSLFGFMGGNNRNIMRTTDGGANWYDCQIDTILVSFLPVTSFTFYNRDYGYATGGQQDFAGIVWRTTNRGVRWTPTVVAASVPPLPSGAQYQILRFAQNRLAVCYLMENSGWCYNQKHDPDGFQSRFFYCIARPRAPY